MFKLSRNEFKNSFELCIEIVIISILIFAFTYEFYRALTFSITHDEAYTYLYCINPANFEDIYVPNNHLLNTILVKVFTFLFGNFEIIVRLPALIGFFLFLLGVYKISKLLFDNLIFQLINVLTLALNPMLLDIFVLSRGYSLALGFMMIGIFFFFKTLNNIGSTQKNNFLSFTFLTISILAITTFIYVFIAVVLVCSYLELEKILSSKEDIFTSLSFFKKLIYILRKAKNTIIKPLIPNAIILILLFGIFVLPLLYFSGFLYWGVKDFFRTLLSFIKLTVQEYDYTKFNYFEITSLTIFILILIFISIFISLIVILKIIHNIFVKKQHFQPKNISFVGSASLLFITIILLYIQYIIQLILNALVYNRLLGNFPVDRTGIYLIPLFFLFLNTLWSNIYDDAIIKYKRLKIEDNLRKSRFSFYLTSTSLQTYFALFFIFLLIIGICNINFHTTYSNKAMTSIKSLALDLDQLNPNDRQKDVYVPTLLEIPLLYYEERYNMDWMNTIHYYYSNYDYDFYILQGDQTNIIKERGLEIINYYSISDFYLCR